ncbi:hypothetical protein SanaruYs_25610 [Chryseotalea sanaruensis]|jgi:hypothetical protein|uniref:YtxH domain-containing protein n=1 Tax=Chryseotalea sanaruensis TaxID=2482724 RepID=A0A401UBS6_9BACT|nr:hypothetical protein [Chryseotalea sanaruensis]GCC52325.1 hypothetical protein SanaruYs_25610 [Chryseotalea sanaruensis]
MSATKKIALGLGVASGALLAAWLLTGDRKKRTKDFIVKKAFTLKNDLKSKKKSFDDSEAHYV